MSKNAGQGQAHPQKQLAVKVLKTDIIIIAVSSIQGLCVVAYGQHHLLLGARGARHAGARHPHRDPVSQAALHEEPVHGRRLQDALAEVRRLSVCEGRPIQVSQGG